MSVPAKSGDLGPPDRRAEPLRHDREQVKPQLCRPSFGSPQLMAASPMRIEYTICASHGGCNQRAVCVGRVAADRPASLGGNHLLVNASLQAPALITIGAPHIATGCIDENRCRKRSAFLSAST